MASSVRFPPYSLAAACLLVLAVLAVPTVSTAQPTPIKIAVVNLDYLIANSSGGKELSAKLAAFEKQIKTEVESRRASMLAIRKQVAEGANSLSQDRLAELQKQYEDAGLSLQRYTDDRQREGQKLQTDGLREIEKQLKPVLEAIRDQEGYDLILNNVPGVVVMVGERVEITQKILDRL